MSWPKYSIKRLKKKNPRLRIHWGRIMVFSIVAYVMLEGMLAFGRKIILEHKIHGNLVQTQLEINRLSNTNARLMKEKEALYTPEKIEELAREKLDFTLPGEIAVRVVAKQKPSESLEEKEKIDPTSKNLWKKYLNKIEEVLRQKWLLR